MITVTFLVIDYSYSRFAEAALKELLPLEEFVSNDYVSLHNYYLSTPDILNNPRLAGLGDNLANWCNVEMENYPDAIEYFENIIDDPPSYQDSILAIIDLNYVYDMMASGGNKSTYIGRYHQYKPATKEELDESVAFHTELLFRDKKMSEDFISGLASLKQGELMQNLPNPFSKTTEIWYNLERPANVTINIFDYTGKIVSTINEGNESGGNHSVTFENKNLSPGLYFYTLSMDGVSTDTKKMTLLR